MVKKLTFIIVLLLLASSAICTHAGITIADLLKDPADILFPVDDAEFYANSTDTAWPPKFSKSNPDWEELRMFFRAKYTLGSKPVTICAVFNMPADKSQGMNFVTNAEYKEHLLINGRAPEPVSGDMYRLPLKKGENTLIVRVAPPAPKVKKKGAKDSKKKSKPKKYQITLVPVELEYAFPRPEHKLRALARTVNHLSKEHKGYPGAQLNKEILTLLGKRNSPDFEEKIKELQLKALIHKNPSIDFEKILLVSGNAVRPANWQGNSEKPAIGKYENSIVTLDLKDFSQETIYSAPNKAAVSDLNLAFDAKKILFSSANQEEKNWQVFEIGVNGSGVRQVTQSPGEDVDNYNGIYLPNGKMIFTSTANMTGVPCVGGKNDVGTFYLADMDGSNVRQLTFEQDADWYPWVMDDGKIMYLRWEYTDNSHYFTRILMTMMPDGARQRSFYGSGSYFPNTMFHAKNIPGSNSRFTAICSGHHGVARMGEIVMFDANKGEKKTDGVIQRIPGYGKKVQNIIRDQYAVGIAPIFDHVFPVSDTFFMAEGTVPGIGTGIYLLDRFDNMVMLVEGSNFFEPIPLKPRKTPPALPSQINPKAKDSVISVQDIYEGPGLKGIPKGTVKSLRVFTYSYGYRNFGGHHQLAIEGGWDCKRLLGTVPVEDDGSVMVRVPHSTPISLQPLDENGQSLQYFRSWLVTMPGEALSCVGCHEPSQMPPLQRATKAMRKAPKSLTPWSEHKLHGFGFLREVQPVLDRNCVGCHDGTKANRSDFKTLETDKGFAKSYANLQKYVRRPGPESDFEILEPMEYHSSTSELIQLLKKGHHGVKMSADDWKILYTWIDLNVPYFATWSECRGADKISPVSERANELRKLYANVDDDPEYVPPVAVERQPFQKPSGKSKPKTGAPKLNGWPIDPDRIQKAQGGSTLAVNLGNGHEIKLRRIPAGAFVMGSNNGQEDERPMNTVKVDKAFWMAEGEITNEQFAQFNPKHDSRFIDQQWKDHIYQGYAANKPHMPVIRVTWKEAMEFCQWLTKKTGKKVTLPTEVQWEWACRAGSGDDFWFNSADYALFANMADKNIGLLAVSGVDPLPVSENRRDITNDFVPRDKDVDDGRLLADSTQKYKPNPWGLYDMHGNVSEWTRTDYKPYPYKEGTSATAVKVVRGGSWRDRAKRSTASYRYAYQPYQKVFNVGFRVIIEE